MGRDRPRSGQGGAVAIKLRRRRSPRLRNRRSRLKRENDLIHHPIGISSDIRGPEPERLKSVTAQHRAPDPVVIRLDVIGMLPAVNFDGHPALVANEVEEVAPERCLTPHVESTLAKALEAAPKDDLYIAHLASHEAGAGNLGSHMRQFVLILF